jgi:PKD repeat protein
VFSCSERHVLCAGTKSGRLGYVAVDLQRVTARRILLGLAALIVTGGFVLALFPIASDGLYGRAPLAGTNINGSFSSLTSSASNGVAGSSGLFPGSSYVIPGDTEVVNQGATTSTTTFTTTTSLVPQGAPVSNVSQGSPGGLIEFSSDVSIRTANPEEAASSVAALAYSVGGYVAYQSTYTDAADVVIRVPASQYQQVLSKVEATGTVLGLTSNSNDVTVQYTDLNATLTSLQTEQGALLRLLNGSTSINSTLVIESQLQGVNQQINEVESQILQTRTLIDYSTIDVTISETAAQLPLSVTLSATPTNGTSPLSVTFNAVVKGGAQPYIVNYNFGDGYASQGQVVIHTFFQPGTYKVLVSATDQNGTVAQSTTVVRVEAAPSTTGVSGFLGYVGSLFLSVVEGIVEVAVVVLPLAAVGAAILIPIQRHDRRQKLRQNQ